MRAVVSLQAGRVCPLHYRYPVDVFAAPATLGSHTLYVVGGVYGNVPSLHRVLEMKREEEQRTGDRVNLLFNGDFNWFDSDADGFVEINTTVLEHFALQGNVEAELDGAGDDSGCGCNYPEYIDAAVVDRSNAIMRILQARAAAHPELRARVAALPKFCSADIGGRKIGIVHGDAQSLAGWGFAYEAMPALLREAAAEGAARRTPVETIAAVFREAKVSAFASTHTGLPFAQDFDIEGRRRLIINNGAAGMPNFKGSTFGLLTRISAHPEVPPQSLYGTTLDGVRFDALPIRYDTAEWLARFLANWPAGSPAHAGYLGRIGHGPEFTVAQANRLARDRPARRADSPHLPQPLSCPPRGVDHAPDRHRH